MSPRTNTVEQPTDETGVYGWDWSATTHDGREGVLEDLARAMGTSLTIPGKGLHGWTQSLQCYDRRGDHIGGVYFGSARDDVHVLSTSDWAQWTRSAVAGMDRARTSRVDTRVDTLVPFDELAERVWESQVVDAQGRSRKGYNMRLTKVESFDDDRNSLGRTIYLGAPTSAIRVRIYEKWLESPGEYVEGTNRVEVQLRPASKVKERVSSWTPGQTFCASPSTRNLAELLGADLEEAGSLHIKRKSPTLEQSLEAMATQYGPGVGRWLEHSGGDLSTVVDYLLSAHDKMNEDPSQALTARLGRPERKHAGWVRSDAADRVERVELPPPDLSIRGGQAEDGSWWGPLDVRG